MTDQDLKLDDFYFENSILKNELKDLDLNSLKGGKNLRSRLLKLTAKIFDLSEEDAAKLGRVVEMTHNATLTHDDVIDNSHTRRGAPSIPNLINNKKSVLVGDYMLAKALHELSDYQNPKLTQELTLTLKELVEGEWIQYENTNPYKITKTLYELLALKKTGSLFRWSFIAPLVAKDINGPLYELFSDFGEKLGIIFQMTDDLIDFNPESKKTYGLDFRNNNINYILHYIGVENPEKETLFLRTDEIFDLPAEDQALLISATARASKDIQEYISRCKSILKDIKAQLNPSNHDDYLSEFETILDLIAQRVF